MPNLSSTENRALPRISTSLLEATPEIMPELPTDHPRHDNRPFPSSHLTANFGRKLSAAIGRMAEEEDSSPAAFMLATLQILTARYIDNEHVNLAVLRHNGRCQISRVNLGATVTFRRVFQVATECLALVDAGQRLSSETVCPLLFSFAAADSAQQLDAGSNIRFELYFAFGGTDCYELSLHYDAGLFDSETIKRLLAYVQRIAETAVVDRESLVWRIPMLPDSEWRTTVAEANNRARTCGTYSIHELFERQAALSPNSIAAQFGDERLSYAHLNSRANQLAHYLQRRGVGRQTPVGICLERSLHLAVALLAVLKAGGTCVTLDPQYPIERLSYMASDARVAMLLTQPHLVEELDHASAPVIYLDDCQQAISCEHKDNLPPCSNGDDTAFILYTSGSTGKPKGILLAHRGLANHHLSAIQLYRLTASDRVLQFSSISFDISLEEMFPAWLAGATVVFRTKDLPLQASGFVRWITDEGITVLDLPTAYWHELSHQIAESPIALPASLRLVIIGGEKASAKAFAEWLKVAPSRIRCVNTYGPAETSIIATAYDMQPYDAREAAGTMPIGRPIANAAIYILDRQLNLLPIGVPGEIYIGGAGVARGYLNQPELTAEKFLSDPFCESAGGRMYKTGDRGRWLPSGNLEFIGRCDLQVKVRGYRVEPAEIEAVLGTHSKVREAVVVANTNEQRHTRLVAFVVPTQIGDNLEQEWRRFLRSILPEYMVPSVFITLPALPLNPNGKVDRAALANGDSSAFRTPTDDKRVTDSMLAELIKIWESVLGIAPITTSDNFWDLGGHSLIAARMIQRIERSFGATLSLSVLFQAPTIAELARWLRSTSTQSAISCLVPLKKTGSRSPFFCVHGVGGTVMSFRTLALRMGSDQPFYGLQAQGLDGIKPCLVRVEDMAARYIQEIRTVQPRGPYYLGGFSFGGWVAWEMAQQLTAAGEQVALLALLDSYPFRLQPVTSSLMSILRIPSQQQLMYVLPKTVRKGIRRRMVWLRLPRVIKQVQRACYEAERRYVLRPYPGRVTLFRATEVLHRAADPYARWRELAGSLEVREIPGHHGDIIADPQVSTLATQVCARIADSAAVLPVPIIER